MDYKKVLNIFLSVSVLGSTIGFLFDYFSEVICGVEYDSLCNFSIGEPLFFGFGQLAIIFLILRFLPKEIFHAWLWFASWYIPLAIIWIVITPAYGGAFLSPSKEGVVLALGGVYMTISILIMLIRLIFLKFKKKKTK